VQQAHVPAAVLPAVPRLTMLTSWQAV